MKKSLLILPLLLIFFSACIEDDMFSPSTTNIEYGDHPLQSFKLHLPANHTDQTKVIIMVQGGGWIINLMAK